MPISVLLCEQLVRARARLGGLRRRAADQRGARAAGAAVVPGAMARAAKGSPAAVQGKVVHEGKSRAATAQGGREGGVESLVAVHNPIP